LLSSNLNPTGIVPSANSAAPAEGDGKYFKPDFVNQVVLQKRLNEIAAAVHLYSGLSCSFSFLTSFATSPLMSSNCSSQVFSSSLKLHIFSRY